MSGTSNIELRKKANDEETPGSETAREAGCKCPVLDNSHGIGYCCQWGLWVVSFDCPMHHKKPKPAKPEPASDGGGWTLVKCEEEDEWGVVRSDYWDEHLHLEDTFYEDMPDIGKFECASENTFFYYGNNLPKALAGLRKRGFRVLENPTWWYDK